MPSYYETEHGYQAKDLIVIAVEPLTGILAFYTGNMIKYACRWWRKGGIEDLKKIQNYAKFIMDILQDPVHRLYRRVNFADRLNIGNRMHPIISDFKNSCRYEFDNEAKHLIQSACRWFWDGPETFESALRSISEQCNTLAMTWATYDI